jgi:hypothetical protein
MAASVAATDLSWLVPLARLEIVSGLITEIVLTALGALVGALVGAVVGAASSEVGAFVRGRSFGVGAFVGI